MTITVSEATEKFDEALDAAQRNELVIITDQGKPTAALINIEEYECLRRRDDAYWVSRAEEARKSGYLSPEETMRFLLSRWEETEGEDDLR